MESIRIFRPVVLVGGEDGDLKNNNQDELARRLVEIGIKPAPKDCRIGRGRDDYASGAVTISTSDGVYFIFQNDGDDIQLLIVGPMTRTPGELASEIHRGYWVKEVEFLRTDCIIPGAAQIIRDRGFISIILRHQEDEMPASLDAQNRLRTD